MKKNFPLLLLSFITFLDVAVLPHACSSTPKDDVYIAPEEHFMEISGGEAFSIGDGTENNPFIIENVANLIYFSNSINQGVGNDAYYELSSNIDLSDINWFPIGYFSENSFNGYFNGNGYEISNCNITERKINSDMRNIGLFGYNSGVIRNLGIVNLNIKIDWHTQTGYTLDVIAGGVVGYNKGEIQNCYSLGKIELKNSYTYHYSPDSIYVGGIAGDNLGLINGCYSNIDIYINAEKSSVIVSNISTKGEIENCLETCKIDVHGVNYDRGGLYSSNCFEYIGDYSLSYYLCTTLELNSKEFYTEKLGWDDEIWNFDNIIFENGKYLENCHPKLYNKLSEDNNQEIVD